MRRTVRAAADLGIEVLTLYSFSSENWSRPAAEVRFLLELLRRFIRTDVAELHKNNVRIMMIGGREGLDPSILAMMEEAESLTRDNTALKLVIAFNYGSRQEITRAVQTIARKVAEGKIAPDDITPAVISNHLDTGGLPDPDLLIRTGGEQRLSNYLLWQCAYTEFVFMPEYWPEFDAALLRRAIAEYRCARPPLRRPQGADGLMAEVGGRPTAEVGRSGRSRPVGRGADPGGHCRCLGGRHLVQSVCGADRRADGHGMGDHRPPPEPHAVRAPCRGRHVRRPAAARCRVDRRVWSPSPFCAAMSIALAGL